MNKEKTITLGIEKSGITKETEISLKNSFMPYFEQAEGWKLKAEKIEITSIDQIEKMAEAREARLNLKKIRVAVEHKRVELKGGLIREGKAIDGFANIVKWLIEPIEEHLQKQEDFVKLIEQQRRTELREIRESELLGCEVYDTAFYNLEDMPEENYQQLLENSKSVFDRRKADAEKEEAGRIEREKKEIAENKRIAAENKILKAAAENQRKIDSERAEKEKEEQAEKEKQAEIMREEREETARIEKEKTDKIIAEKEKQAEIERQKRIKAENEIKEKEEAARIEKEKAETKIQEEKDLKIENERLSLLAPDKDKLEKLAVEITQMKMPDLKDPAAKKIIKKVVELLNNASSFIKAESINL